jgi:hypothetical protein
MRGTIGYKMKTYLSTMFSDGHELASHYFKFFYIKILGIFKFWTHFAAVTT